MTKKTVTVEKPASRAMGWQMLSVLQLFVQRRELALTVVVAKVPGELEWIVTALEGKATLRGSDSAEKMGSLFDEHAHQIVGTVRDVGAGVQLAERYAKAWQRKAAAMKACDCGPIELAARAERKSA